MNDPTPSRPRRILLIEDEPLISMLMEDMLQQMGHHVVAVAPRLSDAIYMAAELDIDLALLDVNLAGEPSFAVADVLEERGIAYFFVTGYGAAGLDDHHAYSRVLRKPFSPDELSRMLEMLPH